MQMLARKDLQKQEYNTIVFKGNFKRLLNYLTQLFFLYFNNTLSVNPSLCYNCFFSHY